MARNSIYLKAESKISTTVREMPAGTHYKLKAYVRDSRDQFLFASDLTLRGKKILIDNGIKYAHVLPVIG